MHLFVVVVPRVQELLACQFSSTEPALISYAYLQLADHVLSVCCGFVSVFEDLHLLFPASPVSIPASNLTGSLRPLLHLANKSCHFPVFIHFLFCLSLRLLLLPHKWSKATYPDVVLLWRKWANPIFHYYMLACGRCLFDMLFVDWTDENWTQRKVIQSGCLHCQQLC